LKVRPELLTGGFLEGGRNWLLLLDLLGLAVLHRDLFSQEFNSLGETRKDGVLLAGLKLAA
jgi:hypothetical protein